MIVLLRQKIVNVAVLGVLDSYGPKIRFGTSPNSSPNTFNTDSENFDFLLSNGVTFWDRSDILAKISVRNFRKISKLTCLHRNTV